MSIVTKNKIIEAAIQLFNEKGLSNVRLQQIADETGISVGNLAYHYSNKDLIVTSVYERLFEEFSEILANYMLQPTLADMETQLDSYFEFFNKYRFYLIDLFEIERSFPGIMEQWHSAVSKMHLQIRRRIDFYGQKKLLVAEPHPGVFDLLTNNIWMTIVFWVPQQILKGQPITCSKFKEAVWSQSLPYLTPSGLEEFFALAATRPDGSLN